MAKQPSIKMDNYNGAYKVEITLLPETSEDPAIDFLVTAEQDGARIANILLRWSEFQAAYRMAEAAMGASK